MNYNYIVTTLALCGQFERIIDELDNSHLGIVALAAAEFDDPGVAAITIFIANAKLTEKPLHRLNAGGSFDRVFGLAFFASKSALLSLKCAITRVKKTSCLTPEVHSPKLGVITSQILSLARQRDHPLDKRTQLFSLGNRRNNMFLLRVYQRSREIAQHRDSMLCRPSQFTVCF